MKTIVEPKKNISSLWGKQRIREDTIYRLMRYVLRVDFEDKVLLHNVVTGQLVLLTGQEADLLSSLPSKPSELARELIINHFLVPEDFDEYRSVNQLRKIYQSRETGDSINHYVILPTSFCNARCFYCYESDYPRVHMTEETAERLIEYIEKHRKGKEVTIQWFGGEPLVGIQRIDQICKGLKEKGIPYTSSMISNGYLFDEEIVERSVSLWNLQRVQITLDGTEDVYNRVKAYVSVQDNPFERVLRNIELLINKKVHVNIRLNVDFYNKEDIQKLIEILRERFGGRKYISVYPNMLFNDQGYQPVHHTQEEILELVQIVNDFTKQLKDYDLGFDRIKIPMLQASQCMADNPHALEIQPDGSFCRCEHETITDSYGNIDDGIIEPQKVRMWRETIEMTDYCPECYLYPACYQLRYCMNADTPCMESYREKNMLAYKELLKSVFYKSLEDEESERVCNS